MCTRLIPALTAALALAMLAACGDKADKDHSHKDYDHEAKRDVHTAPHGGTLVELGEHEANIELKLDPELKKFTLYVLDAHAEHAAKIPQGDVEILILASKKGTKEKPVEDFTVTLKAVANENTGEKVGNTSQFESSLDALKGLTEFDGVIKSVVVKNASYKDVKFSFPKNDAE